LPQGFLEVEAAPAARLGRFDAETSAESDDFDSSYALKGQAHAGNFFLWSYKGADERAHCSHLPHIAYALNLVIEPMWKTPVLDRARQPTPVPESAKPNASRKPAPVVESEPAVEPESVPGVALGATPETDDSAEL
jgi:hypothetical protein